MLIILISVLQVRLQTVTEDHKDYTLQHSLAVDGTPSLLLAAKTSHRAQWHAKQVTMLAHNKLCHISPLLASGDAKWRILSILLDKHRVCYSPSQIRNLMLNPISTVQLQHSEAQVQDDGQKPSSPCPISTFQAPWHSQGKMSSSGKCHHKVYLAFAVLSLEQPPDIFQLFSRVSDMK